MEQIHDKRNESITQSVSTSLNEKPIQNKAIALQDNRSTFVLQKKINNTGLPDTLKSGIENLSGHSMDDVKVHYNSDQPAQLQAHAFAQGTAIYIASGQEKHLAHEAWHVVQQKQGRVKPTLQMKGRVNVNDDKGLEKEADVMGAKAAKNTTPLQYYKPLSSYNANNQNIVQGFWKELAVAAAVTAGALGGAYIGATIATAYSLSVAGAYTATALGGLIAGAASHKAIDLVEDMRPQIHIKKPTGKHLNKYYSESYNEFKKHFKGNPKVKFNDAKQEIWSYYNRIQFIEQLNPGLMMYLNQMYPVNVEESDVISDPFIRSFVNPHFHKKEIKAQNSLAKKSKKRALGFNYDVATANKYKKQIAGKNTRAALINLLNNNAGIVIGESHSESDSKSLFIKYINDIKKAGVDTIYLEHIKEEYQSIMDEWYKKKAHPSTFPKEVLNAADNTDKYHNLSGNNNKYNILNVIKTAIGLGIRVVGIDSLAAATKQGDSSSLRTIKMNVLAEEIIKKDRNKHTGKYIAIVGKAHATIAENNDKGIKVNTLPGMSQLLNIPAIRYHKDSDIITIDLKKYTDSNKAN